MPKQATAEATCSRCGRAAPADPLLEDWEHNLATIEDALTAPKLVWTCPDCLTDEERAEIDREVEEIAEFLDEQAREEEV